MRGAQVYGRSQPCLSEALLHKWLVHVEGLKGGNTLGFPLPVDLRSSYELMRELGGFVDPAYSYEFMPLKQGRTQFSREFWKLYLTFRKEGHQVEVFETPGVGVGLRATGSLPRGTILEVYGFIVCISKREWRELEAGECGDHKSFVFLPDDRVARMSGPSSLINGAHERCANVRLASKTEVDSEEIPSLADHVLVASCSF